MTDCDTCDEVYRIKAAVGDLPNPEKGDDDGVLDRGETLDEEAVRRIIRDELDGANAGGL